MLLVILCAAELHCSFLLFFFTTPPPSELYTLSLHDALPISWPNSLAMVAPTLPAGGLYLSVTFTSVPRSRSRSRSEEHTSELQSRLHLVCRLLLEKKKKDTTDTLVQLTNNN